RTRRTRRSASTASAPSTSTACREPARGDVRRAISLVQSWEEKSPRPRGRGETVWRGTACRGRGSDGQELCPFRGRGKVEATTAGHTRGARAGPFGALTASTGQLVVNATTYSDRRQPVPSAGSGECVPCAPRLWPGVTQACPT